MKLHLGCGNTILPGYVNIDTNCFFEDKNLPENTTFRHLDILQIDRFFRSESVSEIYSHYVFEHISSTDLPPFFYSCASVLKKGGQLKFLVPDIKMILEHHLHQQRWKQPNGLWLLDADVFFNLPSYNAPHRSIWTAEIGKWYLENEGLFEVLNLKTHLPPRTIGMEFTAVKL